MSGLGSILKEEREKKNISLEYIHKRTNISSKSLKALENEEFDQIPGKLHFTNFLKSYLLIVGINGKEFFKEHQHQIESIKFSKDDLVKYYIPKLRYRRFRKRSFFSKLAVMLIFLIGLSALVYFYKDKIDLGKFIKSGRLEVPVLGLSLDLFRKSYSKDFSPINVCMVFSGDCWLKVVKGKKEFAGKTYKKGETLNLKGYDINLSIGNPKVVDLKVNGKKVGGVMNSSKRVNLRITPSELERLIGVQL
jgi:cytoskeletal protein RodZ